MQVKSIAAPVEARASQPSPSAFFLAGGTEVSSFTRSPGDVEAGASVWVSLSFGREMLAAAVMSPDNDAAWLSAEDLAAMSTDEFRTWVLSVFLHVGSCAATMSAGRSEFRSGFAEDPVLAEFYAILRLRLDADLFATTPVDRPAPSQGKRGRVARSAA